MRLSAIGDRVRWLVLVSLVSTTLASECDPDEPLDPGQPDVVIEPSSVVIEVGESFEFTAVVENAEGVDVLWLSHHPAISTVDQTGRVTGVAPGFAIIEAGLDLEDDDIFDQAGVEVTAELRANRIAGDFTQSASRTGTTGQCPAPIAFPATVPVVSTGSDLTVPLAIGDGTATGTYDPVDGSWLATGQATLANGFTVVTTYEGTWTRDPVTRRIRFTGTVIVEHFHPTLGLVCTETYGATFEGEGAPPITV